MFRASATLLDLRNFSLFSLCFPALSLRHPSSLITILLPANLLVSVKWNKKSNNKILVARFGMVVHWIVANANVIIWFSRISKLVMCSTLADRNLCFYLYSRARKTIRPYHYMRVHSIFTFSTSILWFDVRMCRFSVLPMRFHLFFIGFFWSYSEATRNFRLQQSLIQPRNDWKYTSGR